MRTLTARPLLVVSFLSLRSAASTATPSNRTPTAAHIGLQRCTFTCTHRTRSMETTARVEPCDFVSRSPEKRVSLNYRYSEFHGLHKALLPDLGTRIQAEFPVPKAHPAPIACCSPAQPSGCCSTKPCCFQALFNGGAQFKQERASALHAYMQMVPATFSNR